MTIELTPEEARSLMSLLDVAVKAAGLQAAQVALPLAVKLQAALDAPPAAD